MPKKVRSNKIECCYSVIDGIRSVVPYIHEFTTFAKGRWLDREILEVLSKEFGGHPKDYWENAISNGNVLINSKIVPKTYKFKNSDALLHRTHRHEPPVYGELKFIGETDELLAVCKPTSIPMHPSVRNNLI